MLLDRPRQLPRVCECKRIEGQFRITLVLCRKALLQMYDTFKVPILRHKEVRTIETRMQTCTIL